MRTFGAKGMECSKHWAFTRRAVEAANGWSCQILLLLLLLRASTTPLFSAPRIPSLRTVELTCTLKISKVLDQPSEPDFEATLRCDRVEWCLVLHRHFYLQRHIRSAACNVARFQHRIKGRA